MGRAHPIGIVLAAVLFGALYQGGAELAFESPEYYPRHDRSAPGIGDHDGGRVSSTCSGQMSKRFFAVRKPSIAGGTLRRWKIFHALVPVLDSAVRLAVPLLFASLAGLYAERAGVFDIGLEGKMLIAAFAAGAVAAVSGSSWLGVACSCASLSPCFALLHGFATITHRGNQIVSGVAINIIAAGLTAQREVTWFQRGGQTPSFRRQSRFLEYRIAWRSHSCAMSRCSEGIYSGIVSGHSLLVYIAFLMVPFTWWVIYRTRFGLRLRAVEKIPAAADTAGISVARQRYMAVLCGGILSDLPAATCPLRKARASFAT